LLGNLSQHFRRRHPQLRVDRVRRNLRQRLQHEPPFVHQRVRYHRVRTVAHQPVVEEHVEVEGARRVQLAAHAAVALLDVEQQRQQGGRVEGGDEFGCGVEVRRLVGRPADRLGLEERGTADRTDAR